LLWLVGRVLSIERWIAADRDLGIFLGDIAELHADARERQSPWHQSSCKWRARYRHTERLGDAGGGDVTMGRQVVKI
jgi:hypothetical protein